MGPRLVAPALDLDCLEVCITNAGLLPRSLYYRCKRAETATGRSIPEVRDGLLTCRKSVEMYRGVIFNHLFACSPPYSTCKGPELEIIVDTPSEDLAIPIPPSLAI